MITLLFGWGTFEGGFTRSAGRFVARERLDESRIARKRVVPHSTSPPYKIQCCINTMFVVISSRPYYLSWGFNYMP